MTSGIVYFEEIVENIKDATGYGNLRPYYNRIKRFIFNVENEIGYGGVVVLKKKEYTKGDQLYDGNRLIVPFDFLSEWSAGDLSLGVVQGNVLQLYDNGPDKLDFKYLGFLLDENGNPFTTRNRLNAVVAYAVYRLYSQQVFMRKGAANQYQMYREEYFDRVLEARGDDAFPTEEQWNQLGAIKNGGAFEAMTNCGMRTIYQGVYDPSVLNTDGAQEELTCVTFIEAISTTNMTVIGVISQLTKTFIIGVSNGDTMLYGNIWDKDTMVGVSNGKTTIADATLLSPTEATGTTIQISGSANGSSNIIAYTVKNSKLEGRSIANSYVPGTLSPQATIRCYTGIYEFGDPQHLLGGVVHYVDEYGNNQVKGNIWLNESVTFLARSIISVTDCYVCGKTIAESVNVQFIITINPNELWEGQKLSDWYVDFNTSIQNGVRKRFNQLLSDASSPDGSLQVYYICGTKINGYAKTSLAPLQLIGATIIVDETNSPCDFIT